MHSYEVTKIELLPPTSTLTSRGQDVALSNNSITLANLLHDVEFSYESGLKVANKLRNSSVASSPSVSPEQAKVRDGLVRVMQKAGLSVSVSEEEGQRVLDLARGVEREAKAREEQNALESVNDAFNEQLFVVVLSATVSKQKNNLVVEVNDVRSLYPRDHEQGIIDWINHGTLLVVDKEKAATWIDKRRSNSAEVANTNNSFDDAAKVVQNFQNPKLSENNLRVQRVFHGTPHDFDHFYHSKMGTGEGAQVFGWGTYVTQSRGIAEYYATYQREHFTPSEALTILRARLPAEQLYPRIFRGVVARWKILERE